MIAGALEGAGAPLAPPPHSWASRPRSDLAIWHVHLDAGARWTMPAAASDETVRTLYVFGDGALSIDGAGVDGGHAAVVRSDATVELASAAGTDVLVLQGKPIGEPVVQHGPFVLNDSAGVQQAFADYRRTGFGGWPWPSDEPVHADATGRFARYPDGRVERPAGSIARSSGARP